MISLSRIRRELGASPENEERLADTRDAVVALWEDATDRLWSARTGHVEEVRPLTRSSEVVRLRLYPVTAVTSVETRSGVESTWTVLDASEYVLEEPNRLARLNGCWEEHIRVTYDGGYAEDAGPGDVLLALVVQAKFQQVRHNEAHIAIRSQGTQGGSASFMEDAFMHPFFKKLAKRRRRMA